MLTFIVILGILVAMVARGALVRQGREDEWASVVIAAICVAVLLLYLNKGS